MQQKHQWCHDVNFAPTAPTPRRCPNIQPIFFWGQKPEFFLLLRIFSWYFLWMLHSWGTCIHMCCIYVSFQNWKEATKHLESVPSCRFTFKNDQKMISKWYQNSISLLHVHACLYLLNGWHRSGLFRVVLTDWHSSSAVWKPTHLHEMWRNLLVVVITVATKFHHHHHHHHQHHHHDHDLLADKHHLHFDVQFHLHHSALRSRTWKDTRTLPGNHVFFVKNGDTSNNSYLWNFKYYHFPLPWWKKITLWKLYWNQHKMLPCICSVFNKATIPGCGFQRVSCRSGIPESSFFSSGWCYYP